MVVEDLGLPLARHARGHAGLDLVDHVPVAVVVVADVLLVEEGRRGDFVGRAHVGPVPLGDHRLPVGVDRRPQHEDHVVQDGTGLGVVVAGDQVVGQLDGVLGVRDLGGVEAAVDVHQGAALVGERAGLGVAEAARVREAERDFAVAVQVAQILGAGDERDVHGSPEGGAADFTEFEAVAGRVELLEVVDRFLEGGEEEVGPHTLAEYGLGGGDLGVEGGGGEGEGRQREEPDPKGSGGRRNCHQVILSPITGSGPRPRAFVATT